LQGCHIDRSYAASERAGRQCAFAQNYTREEVPLRAEDSRIAFPPESRHDTACLLAKGLAERVEMITRRADCSMSWGVPVDLSPVQIQHGDLPNLVPADSLS
jgi:hypothetical protein